MKHPERIIIEETAFDSGKRVSYLRYDSLKELLLGISEGLEKQAIGDENKNRFKLAELERESIKKLEETAEIIGKMWKISEPHMRDINKI